MRRRGVALLLLLAACKGRTELMVGVVTELRAPDLLDEVRLEVDNNLVPVNLGVTDWPIGNGQVGTFVLPGSYGLNSSDGSEPPVQITLTGLKNNKPVVVRSARTSLVGGKTLFMRMGLVVGCMGNMGCGQGQSCIDGACRDNTVDAHTLPDFKPELVDHITCATGDAFISTKDNTPLPTLGDMQCAGACVEGTCYNPPPDGGVPGQIWAPQPTPATAGNATLHAIWGTSAGGYDVFAVGDRGDGSSGLVLHLQGASGRGPAAATGWVEETLPPGTPALFGVSGSSATDVWAVGANSTLVQRTASGTWAAAVSTVPPGLQLNSVSAVAPSAQPNAAFAAGAMGASGVILVLSNGMWSVYSTFNTQMPQSTPFNGIFFSSQGGAAVGNGGEIVGFAPNLSGFGAFKSNISADLFAMATGGSGLSSIVVGRAGTILLATFVPGDGGSGGGTTMVTPLSSATKADLFGAFSTSTSNVYLCGTTGTILHATDAMNFQPEPSGTMQDIHALWASGSNDIYAVGSQGTVLHSTGAMGSSMTTVDAGVQMSDGGSGGTGCGTGCTGGQVCMGGSCVPCGSLNQPCCSGACINSGVLCNGSMCIACGQQGQPCCPGSSCTGGGCCDPSHNCIANGGSCPGAGKCQNGSCTTCGGLNQACCSGQTCSAGFLSCAGMCMQCGVTNGACCSDNSCMQGNAICTGGLCKPCGGVGQPCCAGNVCTGFACVNNFCGG